MAEQLNNKAAPASASDQAENISKQASPDQAESTINQTQPAQEESTAKQSPSSQDKTQDKSTTKQEPLDLPFPDIDFDFIQKEIDQVKVDNAKKAEKKTSQSNYKGYFTYKLTYMFLS